MIHYLSKSLTHYITTILLTNSSFNTASLTFAYLSQFDVVHFCFVLFCFLFFSSKLYFMRIFLLHDKLRIIHLASSISTVSRTNFL